MTTQSSITSTWVLHEVLLAIQKVYEVLDTMKVYENEVNKYDPHTCEGGLFGDHINTFLKLKADASGSPSGLETLKKRNCMLKPSMPGKACG